MIKQLKNLIINIYCFVAGISNRIILVYTKTNYESSHVEFKYKKNSVSSYAVFLKVFFKNIYSFSHFKYITKTSLMNKTFLQPCVFCVVGIDEPLSKHLAHLFIRDPISLFSEKLDQNDEEDTDHFEVIIALCL